MPPAICDGSHFEMSSEDTAQAPGDHPAASMSANRLELRILVIRGRRVMLDRDLAALYGVLPKRLNEQVKRNRERFPEDDFAFQLTWEETMAVFGPRSQNAALNRGRNVKYAPYVFTEHGAVMLAAVLNSPIAVGASIQVVRAFVRLRELAAGYAELRDRLNDLERKYDGQFGVVFEAIRELMAPPSKALGTRIGFLNTDDR